MSSEELLYEKNEIYVHEPPKDQTDLSMSNLIKIGGRLLIAKNKYGTFFRFIPYGQESATNPDEWMLILDGPKYSKETSANYQVDESVSLQSKISSKYKLEFNTIELRSIKRVYNGEGFASITFMLDDGRSWPPLYFHKGGSKEFLTGELNRHFILKKDKEDPRLWLVQKDDAQAFQQSLYELSLFNEQRNDVVKKFVNQPVHSTLIGLSKVTSLFRSLKTNDASSSAFTSYTNKNYDLSKMNRFNKEENMSSDMLDSMANDNIHLTDNDGFEMVTKVNLGEMPKCARGKPVSQISIEYDAEGRILNHRELKEMIFRGGVEDSIRIYMWKFLLGYYKWDSTKQSRVEIKIKYENDYFRMKQQWLSISDDQKKNFSLLRERENLIDKDVQRTDRTHPYFLGDDNVNLNSMREILMTYNMYNFDLGYVQGMSDLLAPIMVIMNDDIDAFWCFVGFMNMIGENFIMDQIPVKTQLKNLKSTLEFVDSKFSAYLDEKESSNMYFCFRWILIIFKREFEFPQINRLWEVLWTGLPCKNFHLLISIAILLKYKDDMIANQYSFCEILKYVNDLSMNINLEEALNTAEGLNLQLKNYKSLPASICEIYGFPITSEQDKELKDDPSDETRLYNSPSSHQLKKL